MYVPEMTRMNNKPNSEADQTLKQESLLVTVNIDKQGRIVIPKIIRERHKGFLDGGQQLYIVDRGEKLELYLDFRKLPLDEL